MVGTSGKLYYTNYKYIMKKPHLYKLMTFFHSTFALANICMEHFVHSTYFSNSRVQSYLKVATGTQFSHIQNVHVTFKIFSLSCQRKLKNVQDHIKIYEFENFMVTKTTYFSSSLDSSIQKY